MDSKQKEESPGQEDENLTDSSYVDSDREETADFALPEQEEKAKLLYEKYKNDNDEIVEED